MGLHRYNGYDVTSYYYDPQDSTSLSGDHMESICAGRDGIIWVGTTVSGLNRMDPATGVFTRFRHNPGNIASLSEDHITAILEDRAGIIWVGTHNGLNRLDPKNNNITRYQHNRWDSTTISNDQIRSIYEDRNGTLWIGTGSAFMENPTNAGGLNRMNQEKGTFTRYLHNAEDTQSLIDNRVRAIYEDSRGIFWIGTAGDGLHTMNRTTGTFQRHRFVPAHPETLSRPPLKEVNSWAKDHITFIIEDAVGAIWIGTLGNGINQYNIKTKKITHYPAFKDPVTGKQSENAWWAFSSKDGVLWIGYWQGMFKLDPFRTKIPYVATGSPVTGIYEDVSGVLWYGGHRSGLIRKDRKHGTEQRFIHDPNNSLSISNNDINSIYRDKQSILWIGTNNGLNRFDEKSTTFVRYVSKKKKENGLSDDYILSITEDRKGWLWYTTSNGLVRINRQSGTITRYNHHLKDTNSLSTNSAKYIYEDRSGYLWIGTYLGGLNRFDPGTGKFQRFLYGTDVNCVLEDSAGVLWVGTVSGLYRSNSNKTSFSRFRDSNKEIPANIVVSGILLDYKNTLWVNTSIGILKVNPATGELFIYNSNPDAYHRSGSFKSRTGMLFFGNGNGFYAFFPDQLRRNPKPPVIVISEFRLEDKPLIQGNGSILKDPLTQARELRLKYDENIFSIAFAGIHYSNPDANRHFFMLEGLDKQWRKGGEEKTGYYYNVSPGTYTFRIKASSSDGVWTEKAITIIVDPPWWRTWWAYGIYALLVIFGISAIVDYRSRHLRRELELRKKEQRLTELQQQKTELEMLALRAQMNPHFIFNSLNSINRFILENNKDEASVYLTKFSRLIRLILNNSQTELVALESELQSLNLYLELECLRFDEQFEYKITVDDSVDASMLHVPPLTIQPYAENAIWHGLMHKRSKGTLEIDLWIANNSLYCRIKDNGIGRIKAAELKNKSKSAYRSMGMRITSDRIALLKQQNAVQTSIQINDLVLADGNSAGTEIIIQLPVKYD
jgi:ligand-binding sensor domain-containing protein